ncbi:UDP-glucose 4-epimerase GalE [Saccharopolyspora sp. NPDC000359]|uniref:UDP-glucose 4-epimerase GalE n=1 Tax=Saccharopolyspora sp. NPDC000359 TaxID=3154251 RepID=UPI00331F179D
MKLLITGGAGYIGSVVADRLLADGHQVVVVDDLSSGHWDAVPAAAELVVGGMAAAAELLVDDERFDGVVHLAARSLIDHSVSSPETYWQGNTVETLHLLGAMRVAEVPRLVFSSTAATYGQPEQLPIAEHAPTTPTNPYGASKLAADLAISAYARAYSIGAVSLRYFNVAGAVGRFGERHDPETHLIPLALDAALGLRPEIEVFGADYATADGSCVRDFIHVADIADAHVAALASAEPGTHQIYNLGNGTGFTVLEVLGAVEEVTGRAVPRRIGARRPGDPETLIASNQLVRTALGWSPARSTLQEMIEDAYRFRTEQCR